MFVFIRTAWMILKNVPIVSLLLLINMKIYVTNLVTAIIEKHFTAAMELSTFSLIAKAKKLCRYVKDDIQDAAVLI